MNRDARHDAFLDQSDRAAEHTNGLVALAAFYDSAYSTPQIHDDLICSTCRVNPNTGFNSQCETCLETPTPLLARCSCGARETGYPHPGHRYSCRRYASSPRKDLAA